MIMSYNCIWPNITIGTTYNLYIFKSDNCVQLYNWLIASTGWVVQRWQRKLLLSISSCPHHIMWHCHCSAPEKDQNTNTVLDTTLKQTLKYLQNTCCPHPCVSNQYQILRALINMQIYDNFYGLGDTSLHFEIMTDIGESIALQLHLRKFPFPMQFHFGIFFY